MKSENIVGKKILLVLGTGDDLKAQEAALRYAEDTSAALTVLQLLSSHLYHYGRNDVVVPSFARTQFLFHIQENLIREGTEREAGLRQEALRRGIDIRVKTIETEEPADVIGLEAGKGYERIFIPREKKKIFPLLGRKTLKEALSRKGIDGISSC